MPQQGSVEPTLFDLAPDQEIKPKVAAIDSLARDDLWVEEINPELSDEGDGDSDVLESDSGIRTILATLGEGFDAEEMDLLKDRTKGMSAPQVIEFILMNDIANQEHLLGRNFERKYQGKFWINAYTRRYLKVLEVLATLYRDTNQRKEAVKIYERLLKLNPDDNQGIRYAFLGVALAERMLPKARKIFDLFQTDQTACFLWGRVLYAFILRDFQLATKELKKARKANPFMEEFLLNGGEEPGEEIVSYSRGSKEEAFLATQELYEAWCRRQHALLWLQAKIYGNPQIIRSIQQAIRG